MLGVVEDTFINPHPLPEANAAWIIEWDSGFVHAPAGRLANDKDSGVGMDLENWPRSQRQMSLANGAGPYVTDQF